MDFMTHLVQWFIYYGSFIFSPHHIIIHQHFYLKKKKLVNWDHHPISIFKHTHTPKKNVFDTNNEQRTYPLNFLSYEPSQIHSMSDWWLSHPSEKYESVGVIIPNWMENICSKPPTSV